MKNLIKKTLLTESIEFNGSVSELKEYIRFKNERKFKLDWISDLGEEPTLTWENKN